MKNIFLFTIITLASIVICLLINTIRLNNKVNILNDELNNAILTIEINKDITKAQNEFVKQNELLLKQYKNKIQNIKNITYTLPNKQCITAEFLTAINGL